MVWCAKAPREAADAMLRAEVGRLLRTPSTDVRTSRSCPRCGSNRHGRPLAWVPARQPVHVSISRSGPITVVAATTVGLVGVDIQEESATDFADFASVALHPTETDGPPSQRARIWTRKESLLKATGHGLTIPPVGVGISSPDEPPRLVHWPRDAGKLGPLVIHDLDLPAGYRAAVTVLSDSPTAVRLRQEGPAAPSPTATPRTGLEATPR